MMTSLTDTSQHASLADKIDSAHRIVIKVGSALLFDSKSGKPRRRWLDRLGDDIAVGEVTRALRDRYLLCVPAADNVLRLLPPLTISEHEQAIAHSALEHCFSEFVVA